MTLHRPESEVGVRELHDRLSEYLERVEGGGEVLVTPAGQARRRLSGLGEQPLEDLARRGPVRMPEGSRSAHAAARVKASGSVSDLGAEQRA